MTYLVSTNPKQSINICGMFLRSWLALLANSPLFDGDTARGGDFLGDGPFFGDTNTILGGDFFLGGIGRGLLYDDGDGGFLKRSDNGAKSSFS